MSKFSKNQKNISCALSLLSNLDNDQEFYYCKEFIFNIANNKKIFQKALKSKTKLFFYVQNLYIKYFSISYSRKYIFKVIRSKKFDFDKIIELEKKLSRQNTKNKQKIIDAILEI